MNTTNRPMPAVTRLAGSLFAALTISMAHGQTPVPILADAFDDVGDAQKSDNTATFDAWDTVAGLESPTAELSFFDGDDGTTAVSFHSAADGELDVNNNMSAGGWDTAIVLDLATGTPSIDLDTLVLDMRLTNGSGGNNSTASKSGRMIAELVGSSSGSLGVIDPGNSGYPSVAYTRTLDLSSLPTLGTSETFTLIIKARGTGFGHHKSLQALTLNGILNTGGDTTPPEISTLNPDGGFDVPVGTNLVATFDESIVIGTGNITLRNLTGGAGSDLTIASTDATQVSAAGPVLTINPTADLLPDTDYAIQIDASAIDDAAGNSFAGITDDTTWIFTTEIPDTTAPLDQAFAPFHGESDVAVDANLVITFDEDVQAGTGDIVIQQTSGGTFETIPVGAANVTISGTQVTIDPTNDLAFSTGYFVEITDGAIEDLSGNTFGGFSGNTAWAFTTAAPAAHTILATDFAGVDTSGAGPAPTATGITWDTVNGINAPDPSLVFTGADGFHTPADEIAVDRNLSGEGPWSTSISLVLAPGTTSIDLDELTLSWRATSNSGAPQSANRGTSWTVEITGSTTGSLGTASVNSSASGTFVPVSIDLSGFSLGNIQTYTLTLTAANNGSPGHNVAIDDLALTGTINTGPGGNDFSDWISGFSVGGQTGIDDDPDGDGIDSGVENFFGTAPDAFTTGLVASGAGSNSFTFTHPQGILADDLTAGYRWSTDLENFQGHEETNGAGTTIGFGSTTVDGITTVTATVTAGPVPGALFVHVLVTQP